jgi:hypothetical protein
METSTTYTFKLDYLNNDNQIIDSQYYQIKTSETDLSIISLSCLHILYKDNNFYYQNSDDGSINLIGQKISKNDLDNYGIHKASNILNLSDIINGGYSIL